MNCIKRTLLALALFATTCCFVSADQLTRVIQYHQDEQPIIYCATGLLCEIRLARGEHITNPWIAAPLWAAAEGTAGNTPVFMVKPETGGLVTNLILTTDAGRDYHIMLMSYDYNPRNSNSHLQPLYTRFAYDDEQWARIKRERARAQRERFTRPSTPAPMNIFQQMIAACATMPSDEQYGTDVQPSAFRPQGLPVNRGRSVCHNQYATYIQMPVGGPNPTDIPALVETVNGSRRIVNYTYDNSSRIFKVDDVAGEYALTTGHGRHEVNMRVQWQHRPTNNSTQCNRKNRRSCARGK